MAQRTCDVCGKAYDAQRSTSRYCGASCRARASQMGGAPAAEVVTIPAESGPPEGPVEAVTRAELDSAERMGTVLGQAALTLARRLDGSVREPGSAVAALARQLQATMSAAVAGAKVVADDFDELAARRDRKHAG